ncbi:MAG: hypothetical protein M0P59_00345 [Gallionella sp.]|jgi:hypothetical protein|nr:hypothetical protein [Gallionella sp.]MCK9352589.1 hypothetical protein [Gallionella sp.]
MGTFRPLFSVSVEHGYFTDGAWKGLDFVPVPATMKVINGANVLVRPTKNGVAAFYDESRSDALRLYAKDANGALCFSFKIHAKDRTFANYTAPDMRSGNAVLYFDNREGATDSGDGKIRLSKEDSVSEKDFRDFDSLIAKDILCDRDRRVPPDFVVSVCVEPGVGDDTSTASGWRTRDCFIRFDARRAYWKYHLLGNMNRSNPFIVDLDNRVEFEFCGEVMLPGDRPAKVFRSKALIPVLEKSTCRFQLREPGPGTGKVLVKRLPVASESRLGMDVIDGKSVIVAESFINC